VHKSGNQSINWRVQNAVLPCRSQKPPHKSGNGCVIYLHRSWFVLAEFFWWCHMFGICISEFFVCNRVNELFNSSIYSVLFCGLEDTAVTVYVPCFLFVGLSKPVQ
jgi:hypothetical protein